MTLYYEAFERLMLGEAVSAVFIARLQLTLAAYSLPGRPSL